MSLWLDMQAPCSRTHGMASRSEMRSGGRCPIVCDSMELFRDVMLLAAVSMASASGHDGAGAT